MSAKPKALQVRIDHEKKDACDYLIACMRADIRTMTAQVRNLESQIAIVEFRIKNAEKLQSVWRIDE
jgi:hypothetical protein